LKAEAMNPAYSVIFFTVASGAGYGLLALLAVTALRHGPASSSVFAITSVVTALAFITAGLFSSTLHLGHPERAWRALSQWRSSWLSREGVAAVVTYPIALLFGATWAGWIESPALLKLGAAGTILMCLVTIYCTAMIYRSLVTIRQWNHKLVVPAYFALAFATGACLLVALALVFDRFQVFQLLLAGLALVGASLVKLIYWRHIDAIERDHTKGEVTGLGKHVRQWEVPHTNMNFIQKEMGFVVARKHAEKLRAFASLLLTLAACAALLGFLIDPWWAILMAPAAFVATFLERWLFFAEAEHVVTLYYDRDAA
jgi:sulfite dehydrogenase (quinone) subunit SoeC